MTAAYGGGDIGAQHTYTPVNDSFYGLLDNIAALWVPESED